MEPSADRKRVVRVRNGEAREVGTTTEHIRIFEDGDRQVLERTQILETSELGSRVDTTVVVRDTFAPVRYRSVQGSERVEVAYEEGRARTRRIRNGIVANAHDLDIGDDAFDAHALELILRLLPLHEKYKVALPAFDANTGEQEEAIVEVRGTAELDDGRGHITPAWAVYLTWGKREQRYWLSMEGAELVQQSMPLGDGSIVAFVR